MPQPPFHPADIPFSLDVSQPPFHPDTLAAIPPGYLSRHSASDTLAAIPTGYLSRHSTRPTFCLIRMSHNCHSIRPTFHLLRIFHTRRLSPDRKGGRFNFQLGLQIKMSFKLKHLTVEHSCSELVPSIQNFPASLHGNLAIYNFSSICFFDWELIVLN